MPGRTASRHAHFGAVRGAADRAAGGMSAIPVRVATRQRLVESGRRVKLLLAPLLPALAGLAVGVAVLGACDAGNPSACSVLCSSQGACPDGTSCGEDGYCHASDEEPGSCVAGEPDGGATEIDAGSEPPDADRRDACAGEESFAGENTDVIAIPDAVLSGITSTIAAELSCGAVRTVQIYVDITHTFRGDISMTLTSPAGETVIVREMSGGSEDDIHELFEVDIAAGESGTGDWTLNVVDNLTADVGTLDRWTLGINRPAP
jgi:Proprotein convertase P-domain